MTKVSWNDVGQRFYEAGTDRGVLYIDGQSGVPWNGLTSVSENSSGGEPKAYYLDGYKYLNVAAAEEYAATINAFTSPREFDSCDGTAAIHNGLFATQQPRKSFGFSYRTLVGNDVDGLSLGYKIHLVYNALTSPAQRSYVTNGDSASPLALSWNVSTLPPRLTGIRPTAHFVIDSRLTPPRLLKAIEDILYGSDTDEARLPTVEELADLFTQLPPIAAVNWLTNGSFELPSADVTIRRNFIRYPTTSVTGWTGQGVPTLTSEDGKLKVVSTGGSSVRLGVTTAMAGLKGAGNHYVSFVAKAMDPTLTSVRIYLYDNTTSTIRASSILPIVQIGAETKYNFLVNATGEFNIVYMEFVGSAIATGATGYISYPIVENSTVIRPHFNGSQKPKERRNAATLPQAKVSNGWFSNNGAIYGRSWDPNGGRRPGAGAAVFTRLPATPNTILASLYAVGLRSWNTADWVPVTPGDVWTISSHATADRPFNALISVSFRDINGVVMTADGQTGARTPDTAANEWVQASNTVTVPVGAVWMGAGQNIYLSSGITAGGEIAKATDALYEKVSSVASFFDPTVTLPSGWASLWEGTAEFSPSYIHDTDFSVAYIGVADGSESDLLGVGVSTYSSSTSVVRAIQSTRWVKAGTKSLRLIPTYAVRGSAYTEIANHASPKDLIAGNTYTFIATFYQESSQNFGTNAATYRSIALTGATLSKYNAYAQASDDAGEQTVRLTFTVPPSGSWYLRIYNGGMLGDPSVWWDDAAIIDGIYDGPAFDGNTPDTDIRIYDWISQEFRSASTLRSWYY